MTTGLRLALGAVALMSVLAVACGGSSKKTVDLPGGGQVSVDNKVPDNFPKDFPIYSGAKVVSSFHGTESGKTGFVVSWETGDSADKVKSFYDDQFSKGPWKNSSTFDSGGSTLLSAENTSTNQVASVTIANANDKTSVTAFLGDSGASSGDDTTDTPTSSKTSTSSSSSDSGSSSGDSGSSSDATSTSSNEPLPAEVKLSKDFPTDRIPLPSGARVTSSSSFSSGGNKTFVVEVYVKDSTDNVDEYFKTELPKHNWTDSYSGEANGEYTQTYTGASSDPSNPSQEAVVVAIADSGTSGYAKVTLSVTTAAS